MAGVNKAILVGNLGKDPQLDYTSSGTARCRFSLATSDSYNDREGQRQERTAWHNIILWGKLAEIAGEYLAKGRSVYIEGRIDYRQWQADDGQTKYITEIVGQQMQMLGGSGGGGGRRGGSEPPPPDEPASYGGGQQSGQAPSGSQKPANGEPAKSQPPEDDDLPF
jgi:single-strand DNA-binding protein